jgi:predicted component of type VI protein secretion system
MTTETAFLSGKLPNGKSGKWLLQKDHIDIGRAAPADIILPFPTISRPHARITRTPAGYFIADLESRNGTCIGRNSIGGEAQPLSNDDEIVLGGAITLRFSDPEQVARSARGEHGKGILIDEASHLVWLDGTPLEPPLSDAQMVLLMLLYHSPDQVITHAQIVAAVWPSANPGGVSAPAVEGLIKRLRTRLQKTRPDKKYIRVVRGKGIQLQEPEE